jgi:hypothetical protein
VFRSEAAGAARVVAGRFAIDRDRFIDQRIQRWS